MKMAETADPNEYKILGKGEIAHFEQFLIVPHCFQNTCTAVTFKKKWLVWERVNPCPAALILLMVTQTYFHRFNPLPHNPDF